MRYHVLVCSGHAETGEVIAARQTFEKLLLLLLTERFWPHGSDSPGSANLQPGDRVLFCLSTKSAPAIVGDALVAIPSETLSAQRLAETRIYLGPAMPPEPGLLTHAVGLEHVAVWDEPWRPPGDDDPVAFDLAKALAGVYRTGSVRLIARETFERIMAQRPAPPPRSTGPAHSAQQAEGRGRPVPAAGGFTELLRSLWDEIDLGEPLYPLDGSSVGGAPEGPAGRADLVCEAAESGDLVAVSCLHGEPPDRFMAGVRKRLAWLEENSARLGQRVRALVVVVDPRMEVADLDDQDIEVRRLNLALVPIRRGEPGPPQPAEKPTIRHEATAELVTPAPPDQPAIQSPAAAVPATGPAAGLPATESPVPSVPVAAPAGPAPAQPPAPETAEVAVPVTPTAAGLPAADSPVPSVPVAASAGPAPAQPPARESAEVAVPVTPTAARLPAADSRTPPVPVAASPGGTERTAADFAQRCMSVPLSRGRNGGRHPGA